MPAETSSREAPLRDMPLYRTHWDNVGHASVHDKKSLADGVPLRQALYHIDAYPPLLTVASSLKALPDNA